ncbi:MAG: hypothetical protein HFI05_01820 [Lachnospiraceae bacterium]|nr:hypothetical protein [Lachnospiraceae bacterium]
MTNMTLLTVTHIVQLPFGYFDEVFQNESLAILMVKGRNYFIVYRK